MSEVTTASLIHLMREEAHPEREIFDAVGDLSGFELADDLLLVAMYIQQSETKSGLITSRLSRESIYQGKIGLVLKLPLAEFKDAEKKAWAGKTPKVGDWVIFNPQNGQHLSIAGKGGKSSKRLDDADIKLYAGWPCRLIQAQYILGRVTDPLSVV